MSLSNSTNSFSSKLDFFSDKNPGSFSNLDSAKKMLSELKPGATDVTPEWFALRLVDEQGYDINTRDSRVDWFGSRLNKGVMIEASVEGHIGYAATNNLTQSSLQNSFEKAIRLAQTFSKLSCQKMDTQKIRPGYKGSYQSKEFLEFNRLSVDECVETLLQSHKVLKSNQNVVNSIAGGAIFKVASTYVSSSGAEIEQRFLYCDRLMNVTAQKNGITQTRGDGGYRATSGQIAKSYFDKNSVLEKADQLTTEVGQLLDADECPGDTRDLLIDSDQMLLQIHESIGHPLELDRILGDEINYAGSSFVKLEDFGHLQYGSKLLNISFDPTIDGELASCAFDDSGEKAEKRYLIKEGKLLAGIGGLESSERSKVQGTASFRACDWNRAPIDRMGNINLEPGSSSFEDLVSSCEKGLFVRSNRSWSIDDFRNKFQFGCEFGQLIENGRLTKIVRNPNYRGISSQFWKSLKGVGKRETLGIHGAPNCGKGEPNQMIRVGHASPPCLFSNIEVFSSN